MSAQAATAKHFFALTEQGLKQAAAETLACSLLYLTWQRDLAGQHKVQRGAFPTGVWHYS